MSHLLDTSVLARLANTADAQHATADRAVVALNQRGEALHVTPQNLIEFRNLAIRSRAANGLGLSAAGAEAKAAVFEGTFPLLT
jgi:predicted nucleic acid-binding protein